MGARRWTVALDGYLIPIGGGREREVYDDGEQVVLAADHDREVADLSRRIGKLEDGIARIEAAADRRLQWWQEAKSDVAEAEARGWNAAVEAVPHSEICLSLDPDADERDCDCYHRIVVAALRRPEVEG